MEEKKSMQADREVGFSVQPKKSCAHLSNVSVLSETFSPDDVSLVCAKCKSMDHDNVLICYTCHATHCGRSACGHALEHAREFNHLIHLG